MRIDFKIIRLRIRAIEALTGRRTRLTEFWDEPFSERMFRLAENLPTCVIFGLNLREDPPSHEASARQGAMSSRVDWARTLTGRSDCIWVTLVLLWIWNKPWAWVR